MKKTKFNLLSIALALIISACGAEATPTANPLDVQNTAVAAAFTIVAETQAAIPTATALPPTETSTPIPLPTDTPLPPPTLEATITTAPQASGNTDPCNAVMPANPAGKPTRIRLINLTKAPMTVSLYLNITPFGVCGFRGYSLAKGATTVITNLPQGCYNVSVFVNDPKNPSRAFGYGCINNPDTWTFEIGQKTARLIGP